MTTKTYNPNKKIVLIDFDGVLHTYSSGWRGEDSIPDPPVGGAIDWLHSLLLDDELDVRIFSHRCNFPNGITAMRRWLVNLFVGRDLDANLIYNRLTFEPGKPPAHLIIDDRSMQFTGPFKFPKASSVRKFKPWWKSKC